LGLVNVIPIVVFGLLGGMIADTYDRRRVMMVTQSALALFAALLAAITLSGQASVGLIYLFSAGTAAAAAFNNPAQQSLVPRLVPRRDLTNAVSLNTLSWQVGTIVGPGLAGLILSHANIGLVYALNAVSFLAVIAALLSMRYRGATADGGLRAGWRGLWQGWHFVRHTRIIWSTMLLDFYATFFSSARTMLPIVAGDILQVGVRGYALLSTAQPIGAVIAGVILSLRRDIRRQGTILLASVAVYGLATCLFGMATVFAASYVLFALTGAADTVSTVIRGTIRQLLTPDHLRGRMVGVNMMFFMGGPWLGELEAGLVAALFGAPFAIVSGGVITVVLTAWIAHRDPQLRHYTSAMAAEAAPS
jgi:MFS family permease